MDEGGIVLVGESELPRTETEDQNLGDPEKPAQPETGQHECAREYTCSFTEDASIGTLAGRILYDHHDRLRDGLNFQSIYPYLSRERLIPLDRQREFIPHLQTDRRDENIDLLLNLSRRIEDPDTFQEFLAMFQKLSLNNPPTRHDQVDRLLGLLKDSKDPKCLEKFIRCLRDSGTRDAGDAHIELADDLEIAYKKASSLRQEEDVTGNDVPQLTVYARPNDDEKKRECQTLLRSLCSFKCWCCFSPVLLILAAGIIALIIISQVPRVKPPTNSPIVAHSTDVAELDLAAGNIMWVSDVEVNLSSPQFLALGQSQLSMCNGSIHIIRGGECMSLNRTSRTRTRAEDNFLPKLLYLLPGSVISVEIDSSAESDFVYISVGVEAYRRCSVESGCPCRGEQSTELDDYVCFNVSNYRNQPIIFEVNSTDYYSIFASPFRLGYQNIAWTIFEVQFDLQSSLSDEELEIQSFKTSVGNNVIEVNRNWQFESPSCVLYESSCHFSSTDDHSNLTVTTVHRRSDVLLVPGLFALLGFLSFIPAVILFFCFCFGGRKNTKSD